VVSTMPQAAGTKTQAIKHSDPDKPDQQKLTSVTPAAAAVQNASATGGQK
jgi:hypothetical protein